jgi:hypothetical protein
LDHNIQRGRLLSQEEKSNMEISRQNRTWAETSRHSGGEFLAFKLKLSNGLTSIQATTPGRQPFSEGAPSQTRPHLVKSIKSLQTRRNVNLVARMDALLAARAAKDHEINRRNPI